MATRKPPGDAGKSSKRTPAKRAAPPKHTAKRNPGRRSYDQPQQLTWQHRFHIYAKENWYRDVWMVILTIIIIITISAAKTTSDKANKLSHEVAQARQNYIYRACVQTNSRHDNTIKKLVSVYIETLSLPRQTTQTQLLSDLETGRHIQVPHNRTLKDLRLGFTETVLLINALDPKQNCAALVKSATNA